MLLKYANRLKQTLTPLKTKYFQVTLIPLFQNLVMTSKKLFEQVLSFTEIREQAQTRLISNSDLSYDIQETVSAYPRISSTTEICEQTLVMTSRILFEPVRAFHHLLKYVNRLKHWSYQFQTLVMTSVDDVITSRILFELDSHISSYTEIREQAEMVSCLNWI